jgi:hypothetical protein
VLAVDGELARRSAARAVGAMPERSLEVDERLWIARPRPLIETESRKFFSCRRSCSDRLRTVSASSKDVSFLMSTKFG